MGRELDAEVAEKGKRYDSRLPNPSCPKCGSVRRMRLKTGYTQCRDCHNKRTRERHKRVGRKSYPWNKTPGSKLYQRSWFLNRRYGLDGAKYDEMVKTQGGNCAICKLPERRGHLRVDHCHATGKVRGLLCDSCNVGLARFRDNPEVLNAAIAYLGRAK